MKKDLLISALVGGAVVLVVGIIISLTHVTSQIAGDFPGGIQPSVLFNCNTTTNSCTPILANLYMNGGVSIGGTSANNQTALQYTATANYPVSATILGSILSNTSTVNTQVPVPVIGFSVGDPCSEIFYNGVSSSSLVSMDANITAVGSSNATATVLLMNVATTTTTLTVTSTATGVSSTLKLTCRHAGV